MSAIIILFGTGYFLFHTLLCWVGLFAAGRLYVLSSSLTGMSLFSDIAITDIRFRLASNAYTGGKLGELISYPFTHLLIRTESNHLTGTCCGSAPPHI